MAVSPVVRSLGRQWPPIKFGCLSLLPLGFAGRIACRVFRTYWAKRLRHFAFDQPYRVVLSWAGYLTRLIAGRR